MRAFNRLRALSITLLDFISARSATARTVDSLSLERVRELCSHTHPIGILPYRDNDVSALVWEMKYNAYPHALSIAKHLLCDRVLSVCEESLGVPLLVSIPARREHVTKRGHDSLARICQEIAHELSHNIEYAPHLLRRVRDTLPQQGLLREARLSNVAYSLEGNPDALGRVCIVIDDVTTTGATLTEAARALSAAGASEVVLLSLAFA